MSAQEVARSFHAEYGYHPEVVSSAPGRVNLIGEHTDYNGGEVLPIAIERRTWVAMSFRKEAGMSRAFSTDTDKRGEFNMSQPARSGEWWDYISAFGRAESDDDRAVDLAVSSDVPAGAGLSSSAALQIAAGTALAALTGESTRERDLALRAWKAESEFVGVSSGIMDQFACALSKEATALHVWCATREFEHVPFEPSVLVFDTAVPRSLRSSAFNERQRECAEVLAMLRQSDPSVRTLASVSPERVLSSDLPNTLKMRALHVSEETRRVGTAVLQLQESGTIEARLLYESHASLRDHYQCSSRELDWFVDHAMNTEGVKGARLTGAGWGGCAIALGDREALDAAGRELAHDYERTFGLRPRTWLTEASFGARVETA